MSINRKMDTLQCVQQFKRLNEIKDQSQKQG